MAVSVNTDTDFGHLLLEKKIITRDQLLKAYEQRRIKGGYLSQHLIELGYMTDVEIANIFTCHYGFCYLPLTSYDVQESAIQIVSHGFACDYRFIPLEKTDKLLSVAMADPLNKGVIEALRQATHCEIIIFISTFNDVKEAIEKYYKAPFQSFQLDKFQTDPILRDNLISRHIAKENYFGINRRRYRRLVLELDSEGYVYPNVVKTKVSNISMSGVLFETTNPFPKGTQLIMEISLKKGQTIETVLEVSRCNIKYSDDGTTSNRTDETTYQVGAYYNFVSEEDQNTLSSFLKHEFDT